MKSETKAHLWGWLLYIVMVAPFVALFVAVTAASIGVIVVGAFVIWICSFVASNTD